MEFKVSGGSANGVFRVIAWSATKTSARQLNVQAGRLTRIGSMPGEIFEIQDPQSGRPVHRVRARRVGNSLLLVVGEQNPAQILIESYFEESGDGANGLGVRSRAEAPMQYLTPSGRPLGPESMGDSLVWLQLAPVEAVPSPVATRGANGITAVASSSGISPMAGVGAGALAVGLLAGGAGGGGGGSTEAAPVLKSLNMVGANDALVTRAELSAGLEMVVVLGDKALTGATLTLTLTDPAGRSTQLSRAITEADRVKGFATVVLNATQLLDPALKAVVAGDWSIKASLAHQSLPAAEPVSLHFAVESFVEVLGSVTAGPMSQGMAVRLFDARGQALAMYDENDVRVDFVLVKADGSWKARLAGDAYRGPIVVRASDINGPAPNYLDEVMGESLSLDTSLHAVGVVEEGASSFKKQGGTVSYEIHVTPLTELAARRLGVAEVPGQGSALPMLDASAVTRSNQDVAEAFGLRNVSLTSRPTPTNSSEFGVGSGRMVATDAEKYGLVLAKLSGVDALNAHSVARTLDQFETQVRSPIAEGVPATLSPLARSLLDQGGAIALAAARDGVGTFLNPANPTEASALRINLLGDVQISRQDVLADGSLNVVGRAAPGGRLRILRLSLPSGVETAYDYQAGPDGRFDITVPAGSGTDSFRLVPFDLLGAELSVPLVVPVAPEVLSVSRLMVQGSGMPGTQVEIVTLSQEGQLGEPQRVTVDDSGLWHYRWAAGQSLPLRIDVRTIDSMGNVSDRVSQAVGSASLGLVALKGEDGFINRAELTEPVLQLDVSVPAGARLGDLIRVVVTVPSGDERVLGVALDQADLDLGRLKIPLELTDAVREGQYDLSATYVGRNASTIALSRQLVVDTIVPVGPVLGSADGLWLSGRTEVGSRVQARLADGTVLGVSDYAGSAGSWAIRLTSPVILDQALRLVAYDAAGNASAPSLARVNASHVRILSFDDDRGPIRGLAFSGASTDDDAPLLTGTLSQPLGSRERLVIYRNGVAVGDAVVSDMVWSFQDGNGASASRMPLAELPAGQGYVYRAQIELPGTTPRASGDFELVLSKTPVAIGVPQTSAGPDGIAIWREIDEQGGVRLVYEVPRRADSGDRLAAVVTDPIGQTLTLPMLITDQHRAMGSVMLTVPEAFLQRVGDYRIASQYTAAASGLTSTAEAVSIKVQLESIPVRSTPLDDLMIGGGLPIDYFGREGNDTLIGGSASDTLDGGPGTDWVMGGGGDDLVRGSDRDTLGGGPGNDRFEIVSPSAIQLDGNEGDNVVDLRSVLDTPAVLRVDGTGGFMVSLVGQDVISGEGVFRFQLGAQPWTIIGSTLNDPYLVGGSNDDTIFGNMGDDTIDGGAGGLDLADYRDAPAGVSASLWTGRSGGGDGIDVLISIERLAGSANNDTLEGGIGDDTLTGRAGEDLFVARGSTDVIADLGIDRDAVRVLAGATLRAEVVRAWTASAASSNEGLAFLNTAGWGVNLAEIGSGQGWHVTNNGLAAALIGSRLNDTLIGGDGRDTLRGGPGDDLIVGGVGDDRFEVDAGIDTIVDLGSGRGDILIVQPGATADATVVDAWDAGPGTANYGQINLRVAGQDINLDTVDGGQGWQVVNTGSAARFIGSQLNDTLEGGVGDDTLAGRLGEDRFVARGGTDTIIDLGVGRDVLQILVGATAQADVVQAWTASVASRNDGTALLSTNGFSVNLAEINTGSGWTVRNRGNGAILIGSALDDTLEGGGGDDTLRGGGGRDSITGGLGSDLFDLDQGFATITDLGRGDPQAVSADILVVRAGAAAAATVVQAWIAGSGTANYGAVDLQVSGLDVDLGAVVAGQGWRVINSGSAVRFVGSQLDDSLGGGTGNDTLVGRAGNDTLSGGAGADTFEVDLGADRITDLGLGADIVTVAADAQLQARVLGAWTAATSSVNRGAVLLETEGHAVDLSSISQGNGWTLSNVGAGALLRGSGLADTISGGSGDDTLNAGPGADRLTGGEGADNFLVESGLDTVTDLGRGSSADVLRVSSSAEAQATVVAAWIASAASSNEGVATLTTAGSAVDLSAVLGQSGWSLRNQGAGTGLTGSRQIDTISGGQGNDTLRGGLSDDQLTGGAGDDTFVIDAGIDSLSDLGLGSDVMQVLTGARIDATVAANWMAGAGSYNDSVAVLTTTGFSVDLRAATRGLGWQVTNSGTGVLLVGSSGGDTLTGGAGSDTVAGRDGSDVLQGGSGIDRVDYSDAGSAVEVNLLSGSATGGAGVDILSGFEQVLGSVYDDTLRGGSVDETLTGGEGGDLFVAAGGTDTVTDLGLGADDLRVGFGSSAMATLAAAWTATDRSRHDGILADLSTDGYAVDLTAVVLGLGWRIRAVGAPVRIDGSGLDDVLIGAVGEDTLSGGAGNDTLTGAGGADRFLITAGVDRVTDLGLGADVLVVSSVASVDADLAASWTASNASQNSGTARLSSNGYSVDLAAITSGLGYTITNIGAATTLRGSQGVDTIVGGSGDDTVQASLGNDSLDGGVGIDLLDYQGFTGPITVDLARGEVLSALHTTDILNFEQVRATAASDTIIGGEVDETLTGGLGADTFEIDGGLDQVLDLGEGGGDVLKVAASGTVDAKLVDAWVAGAGSRNDGVARLATVGSSINLFAVTEGRGWQLTNSGPGTALIGSSLNDTLIGGPGSDTLTGGLGADRFEVTAGSDRVTDLGNGQDVLAVSPNATVNATVSSAWIATTASINDGGVVNLTTPGHNVDLRAIVEGSGWRLLNSGSAARLIGTGKNDTLTGGSGNDTLMGREGDDTLDGSSGGDMANYELLTTPVAVDLGLGIASDLSGTDTLISIEWAKGGSNNDTMTGGSGSDTFTGGDGADTFRIAGGTDTITDLGLGVDIVEVFVAGNLNAAVNSTSSWTATAASRNLGTALINTPGRPVSLVNILNGNGWQITNTGSAATTLIGSALDDTLTGGQGNDTLTGGIGGDLFRALSGTKIVTDLGTGPDSLEVRPGAELQAVVSAPWTASSLSFNDGSATLSTPDLAVNLSRIISGRAGWVVTNTGSSGTSLTGSDLNDRLTGGSGNDTLSGASGDDVLIGGDGNDRMTAGAGSDQISMGSGHDVFVASADWLLDVLADTIDGGLGFDSLRLEGGVETLDLTNGVRFADSLIESIERIDLGLGDEGRQLTLDPASILALTDLAASASALIIDGDSADSLISTSSLTGLAAPGTIVLVDMNGNGSLADTVDNLGPVGPDGRISYDFSGGTQPRAYDVYAGSNYGLLLVESGIGRGGVLIG
jgi:Ca2+-binding RTX toxin-like protein